MSLKQKPLRSTGYILALLIIVIILFYWYSAENNKRIEEQNRNYAADSARQTVSRIEDEFRNAESRINTYSYFLGEGLLEPSVTSVMLTDMAKNSLFDAFHFADKDGNYLTEDGSTFDVTDRPYYINGMKGETGIFPVLNSRVDSMPTVSFYSPVYYQNEIIGVLVGVYSADNFLQHILSTSYFGEAAEVYLCTTDRTIIASSSGLNSDQNPLDNFLASGALDETMLAEANKVFDSNGERTFICKPNDTTDNICIMHLENSDFVLIQAFPKNVTQNMIRNANRTGIMLEIMLIGAFLLYIVVLLLEANRSRKLLAQENLEMGYVIGGINTLFSRFAMIDFEEGTYQYLAGTSPERPDFARSGDYRMFISYLCSFLVDEKQREELAAHLEKDAVITDLGEEGTDLRYEYQVQRNGQISWEHMNVISLERRDGKVTKILFIRQNITELKEKELRTQEALQDALMQAQHANNAKTTFLSNMSHDIRTPMNAIIGFATIAVSHINNREQVMDCLQKVLSSSNHLLSLINDILDMSRIESGKIQIKEQECNISELMHNLVNIIQPQVKAKQLELFIDTFDVTNENVIADSLKLNQIFVNLLSNAVKYTPAGGIISFRIKQKTTFRRGYGDYIFIVKDNGIGMEPEFVKHIFEPFEREESTTRSGIQGTGLGMSITKNIIDMMGGTITVTSEKGKGSEFTVTLSLKFQDLELNATQIKELEGLRALVVDDDFDTCDSVSRMLTQIGLRSEWTTSGREAVYRAQKAHNGGDSYHTFILDWQMPEMSGIETARRIRRAVGNEAPIIILTAYDWSDIEAEAREAGITAFCAKPLFMSDLKTALLAANNLISKEDTPPEWTQADFTGKRILLVEDNELNREIAESILCETGFLVESAPDGTDAVSMMKEAEEGYYDAILMDVQMPIMNGYEATRTIRNLPRADVKDLPIIAMTANAMEEDKEAALKNGMNAHLAKPISVDLFIATLAKFLKQ